MDERVWASGSQGEFTVYVSVLEWANEVNTIHYGRLGFFSNAKS